MDSRCAIMGTCKSTPLEIYHAARIKQKHRSKPRLPPVLCHRCSFYQFRDDVLAQQQSSRGRHPYERTGNTSPSGGRSLQLLRFHRLLRAEHDGVVRHAALPQLPPHNARKRAAAGLGNVGDPQQRCVLLVPSAEGGDDRLPRSMQLIIRSTLQETRSIASTT